MHFSRSLPRPCFPFTRAFRVSFWIVTLTFSTGLASSVLNFPRLSGAGNELTGIALVNPNNQLATVIFTAYGSDGTPLSGPGIHNPAVVSAFARRQYSALTSDLFGALDPATVAWFQATSSLNNIDGFFLILDPGVTQLDGAELPKADTRVVFREVRLGGGFSTELNLVNPNSSEAQVTLQVVGQSPATSRMVTLAPMGAVRLDAAEFFALDSPPPSAVVVATSNVAVAGFGLVRGGGDSLGLNARATRDQAGPLFFPQLAALDPFQTQLQTLNSGEAPARVTISAFSPGGTLFGADNAAQNPVVRNLQPGQTLTESVEQMFGLTATGPLQGWARIDSDSAGIEATLSYAIPSIGSLAAVAGVRQGSTRGIFSHIATTRGFFTGVAILNPTSLTANLQVAAIRLDGETLGSVSLTLGPGERVSRLITDWIPAAAEQAGGLVWIVSDVPVRTTSLFGSQSGVLANIPPQSIPASYVPDDVPAPTSTSPKLAALSPGQSQAFEWSGRGAMPIWRVNGIVGGDAEVGTIDSLGVYHAPASPPGPLPVSVSAERGSERAGATVDLLPAPTTVADLGLLVTVAHSVVENRLYVAEISSQIGGSGGEAGTEVLDLTDGSQRLLASLQGEEVSKIIVDRLNDRDYLFMTVRSAGLVIRLNPDTLESRIIVQNLNSPASLTIDPVNGDLLVAESNRVSRVLASRLRQGLPAPAGGDPSPASPAITTVFQGDDLKGVAVDRCSGKIYASDALAGTIIEYDRGSRATRALASDLDEPGQLLPLYRRGIACPSSFHLLAVESGADRIRLLVPAEGLSLDWMVSRGLVDFAPLQNDGSDQVDSLLLAAFPRGISGTIQRIELPDVYRSAPEVNP